MDMSPSMHTCLLEKEQNEQNNHEKLWPLVRLRTLVQQNRAEESVAPPRPIMVRRDSHKCQEDDVSTVATPSFNYVMMEQFLLVLCHQPDESLFGVF
jgi:hypothetical protein